MKVGVFLVLFADRSLEESLDIVKELGAEGVEIACGGFLPKTHCDPAQLLKDEKKILSLEQEVKKRGLFISGLSCHGNPLHPNPNFSRQHIEDFKNTVLLAEKLGVEQVILFAGCPGDSEHAKIPNWITCPWPPYYSEILQWQWEERIIPFWKEQGEFVSDHGVKICFEMHPGDAVYNPEKLLKLREAVGDVIGANLDPSHLFWQGIDPVAAVRKLAHSIYYVHAKDTEINQYISSIFGVLDTKPYTDQFNRAWNFRTVGYGHGEDFWKRFICTLRLIGYDYVLSIEHEDQQMSIKEGLGKSIEFLKKDRVAEKAEKPWFV